MDQVHFTVFVNLLTPSLLLLLLLFLSVIYVLSPSSKRQQFPPGSKIRLHPPAPFLIPRRAAQTCKIMGYTIPKNPQVLVNVWSIIGRDPSVWEDPLSFKPERFLGTSLDFKGQHFELLPFDGGRRICPGLPTAARQVPLILATLLHSFDRSLPNNEDPANLDMNDKFGITVQKE